MRAAALIALALCQSACAAATPAPAAGWVVERVIIDPALSNSQQRYFEDDPRLLGRLVSIRPGRAEIDNGSGACTMLRGKVTAPTASTLIATVLPASSSAAAQRAMAGKLGLARSAARVPVTTYLCAGPGDVPPGRIWTGTASFPLGNNRLALVWESEVVLLLKPDAGKTGSANRCMASGAAARAICADRGLAAWDRSVRSALAIARSGNADRAATDDVDALDREQSEWLTRRDACKADRTCLEDSMIERTGQLLER